MNKLEYFESLKQIEQDKMWIGKYGRELSKEVSQNMWAIPLPKQLLGDIELQDMIAFLERVIKNRLEQVQKFNKHGMIFYVWLDEETGHLHLNCISNIHKQLPFECETEITENLEEVVEGFLAILEEDIANDDSYEVVEVDEIDDEDEDEDEDNFVLVVYVRQLNVG